MCRQSIIPHGYIPTKRQAWSEDCAQLANMSFDEILDVIKIVMRCEARKADLVSIVVRGKNASSYLMAFLYEGNVPRITSSVCVFVCPCFFFLHSRPRFSTALNVHGTNTSSNGSCARIKCMQLPSGSLRRTSSRVRRDGRNV